MAPDRAPVPNPTTSFWNADALPFDDLRSTKDLPSKAEIVIIGAGFAGIASILQDAPLMPLTCFSGHCIPYSQLNIYFFTIIDTTIRCAEDLFWRYWSQWWTC